MLSVSDPRDTGVRVETLGGEIDVAAIPELAHRLTSLPNTLHQLIVDLSEVSYMDSSGVQLLHELNERMRIRSQRLIVVSPQGTPPRRVLDLTAFGERVALEDSLGSALAAAQGWT